MVDGLCLFDLDPEGLELDAPLDELYQDLVHRLLEEPASNLADIDRGVGILGLVSSAVDVSILSSAIEQDFLKDPRVHAVQVSILPIVDAGGGAVTGSYNVAIQVVPDPTQLIAADGLQVTLVVNADGTYSEIVH
jgi:hypothetical protein